MVCQRDSISDVSQPSDRLLDAVVDLLAAGGYEGISIRRVAAAAGVSIGAVQHHFLTKDALLAAAVHRVSEQFQARLEARLPEDAAPGAALREVADALVGADDDQRRGSVVWLVRAARAAVDARTALAHQAEWSQVEDLLAHLIAAALPDLAETAVRERAGALLALLDGLAVALVAEPGRMGPARARALVASHLDVLLDAPLLDAPPGGAG